MASNPYERLVITRILLLSPSTAPVQISPLGPEPVQQQGLVGRAASGRLSSSAPDGCASLVAPSMKKSSGPEDGLVTPEMGEGFFQLPGPAVASLLVNRAFSFCRAPDEKSRRSERARFVVDLKGLLRVI